MNSIMPNDDLDKNRTPESAATRSTEKERKTLKSKPQKAAHKAAWQLLMESKLKKQQQNSLATPPSSPRSGRRRMSDTAIKDLPPAFQAMQQRRGSAPTVVSPTPLSKNNTAKKDLVLSPPLSPRSGRRKVSVTTSPRNKAPRRGSAPAGISAPPLSPRVGRRRMSDGGGRSNPEDHVPPAVKPKRRMSDGGGRSNNVADDVPPAFKPIQRRGSAPGGTTNRTKKNSAFLVRYTSDAIEERKKRDSKERRNSIRGALNKYCSDMGLDSVEWPATE